MDDNSKNSINNENKDDNDLSIEFFSEKEKIEKDGVAATEILEDGKVSDSSEGFCESIEFFDPEEEIYGEKVFEHTEFSEKNDINFEEESELGEENTEDVFSDSEKVSEDEENAPEEEKSRKKRNIIVIVCVIIAAILLLKYYKDFNSTSFIANPNASGIEVTIIEREDTISTKYDVQKAITTEKAAKTYFRVDGKSFFYCTRDGIKYYSDMDNLEWTDIYTLTSPSIIYESGVIAITETSSKTIRVYTTEGYAYSANPEGSIVQASLSKGGYLALIVKNEVGYSVQVYDSTGKLVEERIDKGSGLYPVSADISDDNRILAVSYIDTGDIYVKTNIMFLYIDAKEGEEYMDSIFANVEYEEEIVPWISFMKGNKLLGVSDTSMFSISEAGSEEWKEELKNEISLIYKYDDERVIIAYGDERINKKGKPVGTISWYNLSGKEEGSYECGKNITYISANEKGIVAGCGNLYRGINYSGKSVWQIVATQTVDDVAIMEKINNVLYVTRGKAEILKMR